MVSAEPPPAGAVCCDAGPFPAQGGQAAVDLLFAAVPVADVFDGVSGLA